MGICVYIHSLLYRNGILLWSFSSEIMLQQCFVKAPTGALGLNLSRAPWDPYPWVSGVQSDSNAQLGGICIGDTLLQLNGRDVLGLRISELAKRLREHWLTGADHVIMLMWRQQPTTGDPQEAAHVEVSLRNSQGKSWLPQECRIKAALSFQKPVLHS